MPKTALVADLKNISKYVFVSVAFAIAFKFMFHFSDWHALGLGAAFAITREAIRSQKSEFQDITREAIRSQKSEFQDMTREAIRSQTSEFRELLSREEEKNDSAVVISGANENTFLPHSISIQFNLRSILLDIKLLSGEEQWVALAGARPKHNDSWEEKSVYHSPIVAYAISADPSLFHYPDLGTYSTRWELELELEGLKLPGFTSHRLTATLRRDYEQHSIGISVDERWWKANRQSIARGVIVQEEIDSYRGTAFLSLAVIPNEIFRSYHQQTESTHRAMVNALVQESGWRGSEIGDMECVGEFYEHKYAYIWVRYL